MANKIIDIEAKDITDIKPRKYKGPIKKKKRRPMLPKRYRYFLIAERKSVWLQKHKVDIMGVSVPVLFIFLGPVGWYMAGMYIFLMLISRRL